MFLTFLCFLFTLYILSNFNFYCSFVSTTFWFVVVILTISLVVYLLVSYWCLICLFVVNRPCIRESQESVNTTEVALIDSGTVGLLSWNPDLTVPYLEIFHFTSMKSVSINKFLFLFLLNFTRNKIYVPTYNIYEGEIESSFGKF